MGYCHNNDGIMKQSAILDTLQDSHLQFIKMSVTEEEKNTPTKTKSGNYVFIHSIASQNLTREMKQYTNKCTES